MNDERALLEHRIAWLEREMVRLLWAFIGLSSLLLGSVAYAFTVDSLGGLGAFGVAVVVWAIAGWYFRRHELRGAPGHVERMDP